MLPTTPTAEMTRSAVGDCVPPLPSSMVAVTLSPCLSSSGHLGAGQDLDALLLERLAGERRDLGVLDGQDLRQQFDHRHLRAHGAVERRELDPDGTGADHQQRLRHPVRRHGLEIGPDQLLVRLDAGEHARPRAGREDDVLGLIRAGPERPFRRLGLGGIHGDPAGRLERGLAPDHRDLVLPEQEGDALGQPLGDAARAFDHGGGIVGDLLGREPELLGVRHQVEHVGRAQQRLGRDAAPVGADAADEVALDHRDLEAELRGADGGDVAAGAGADDDDVEGSVGHCLGPR